MQFKKTVLKNGLRVITVPLLENPAVTILVMVETGSKYEQKEINGISHFLEHMVFKGTPRRPKAVDISKELESLGADYNAFTSQEYTGYYAKVAKKHTDKALDIISDMYLNPLLQESEIKKEKGVIIEEIKMYNDLPQRKVHDIMSELMFGDQPTGWTVLGTPENINSFSQKDFVEYRNKHYVASSTIVVVAGAIDEAMMIKKVENAFSNILTSEKYSKLGTVESQSAPQVKLGFKETDQTHLVISLRTFSIFDKRIPTMRLLSTILGGGMSSRLFSKMRDELGICYYIHSSHSPFTDHGDLAVSAGVDNKRVDEALKHIMIELKRLRDEPISSEELQKAKDYIAGSSMLDLETSDELADFAGFQEIIKKKIEEPEALIEKTNRVTAEEIQKLAEEIFVDEKLNLAIIGPYKDEERFLKLLTFN